MRKIKGSGGYLKNQTRKNLAKALFCILIFATISIILIYRILSTLEVSILEGASFVFLIAPLIAFYFYLRRYHIYNGGWQGEKMVVSVLGDTLSDDYYLLNDLYLKGGGGDIDHIVLGPNGIFVLETKNWSGPISCNGDEWQRGGKRKFSGSPSRQVKRNAAKIQYLINNSSNLRRSNVLVEGIVVFTNNRATLRTNNSAVPILRIAQLPVHITSHKQYPSLSKEQIEAIGREIVLQKH